MFKPWLRSQRRLDYLIDWPVGQLMQVDDAPAALTTVDGQPKAGVNDHSQFPDACFLSEDKSDPLYMLSIVTQK